MLDKNTSRKLIPAPQKVGLRTSFDRTANLTFQPRNVKRKIVKVLIDNYTVGGIYFFPYDDEIDNSIVLGIRFVPAAASADFGENEITSWALGDPQIVTYYDAKNLLIVLVNKENEQVMQPYPLIGLYGSRTSRPAAAAPNGIKSRVYPKFYLRLSLTKCYLKGLPGTITAATSCWIEFTYKPVQLNK